MPIYKLRLSHRIFLFFTGSAHALQCSHIVRRVRITATSLIHTENDLTKYPQSCDQNEAIHLAQSSITESIKSCNEDKTMRTCVFLFSLWKALPVGYSPAVPLRSQASWLLSRLSLIHQPSPRNTVCKSFSLPHRLRSVASEVRRQRDSAAPRPQIIPEKHQLLQKYTLCTAGSIGLGCFCAWALVTRLFVFSMRRMQANRLVVTSHHVCISALHASLSG